jgi:hypothetical protein
MVFLLVIALVVAMRIIPFFVTGLMINDTDLVISEAMHQAMRLHRTAMRLRRSGPMPMHDFDLKALACELCRFDEKFILKYRGGNSHEAVVVVRVVGTVAK